MELTPRKAIRRNCLDCCCGSRKAVAYCTCTDCNLWPHRFGISPAKVRKHMGGKWLNPKLMPDANVPLGSLHFGRTREK